MKAKKRLGQNFLHDKNILQKIIQAGEVCKDDLIIEVGAGRGALTEELVKHAGHVKALEIDDDLIPGLRVQFAETKNLEIIHEDVLKYNINDAPRRDAPAGRLPTELRHLKVIANIPYYITSPIIRHFLIPNTHITHSTPSTHVTHMILLIQKEVAEKIVSKRESVLSLMVKTFAKPEIICTVPKTAFTPQPKVESAVIKLTTLDKPRVKGDIEKFLKLIKIAFAQPRKTLANNLANGLHREKSDIENMLEKLEFDKKIRAEKLSFEDWERLLKKLEN